MGFDGRLSTLMRSARRISCIDRWLSNECDWPGGFAIKLAVGGGTSDPQKHEELEPYAASSKMVAVWKDDKHASCGLLPAVDAVS